MGAFRAPMTADQFRAIALALQGVVEGAHMGHPDFRANGRIFATLHPGGRTGMVKLSPEEQQVLLAGHPEVFEPSSGAWGRQGCTNVTLARVDTKTLRSAMLLGWEGAMARPPAKARSSRPGRASSRPRRRR